MADSHPGDPPTCEKCGAPCLPPKWDPGLALWRSKCSSKTPHPISGKQRPSPHESFHPGLPAGWTCLAVIPCVADRPQWSKSLQNKRKQLIEAAGGETPAATGSAHAGCNDPPAGGTSIESTETPGAEGQLVLSEEQLRAEEGKAGGTSNESTETPGAEGKTTQQSAEIDHLDQFDALLNDFEKIGKVPDPDNEPPAVEPDVPGMTPKKANKPTQEDDLDYLVRRLEDMQPGTPKEQVPDAEPPVTPVKKKKKMNPENEPERDVNPGEETVEEILQWARRVEHNGVYLEFLDVFLVCAMHGLGLKLFTYEEGNMEVVDAFQMVKDLVPEFYMEEALHADERYTACAVFCRGDYQKAAAHSGLNHWVPAALKNELEGPEEHWNLACSTTKKKIAKEMKQIDKRKSRCNGDEALLASMEAYREQVRQSFENFAKMQKDLWESKGLLCKHVEGDGNCGVYMLLSLIQDVPANKVDFAQAARFRVELRKLWEQHAALPMWQSVWRTLRQRLGSNQPVDPSTPSKNEKAGEKGLPFTPDKMTGQKRLLPAGAGTTPSRDVVVPGAGSPEEPEKKRPKPTGKPNPIKDRLNFKNYFERWLAECGVTYRTWVSQHRTDQVWVRGSGLCPLGHWASLVEDLAERKWPEKCESCLRLLRQNQINPENAAETIAKLHEKVKADIERLTNHKLKPLKRKQGEEPEVKSVEVKKETGVKEEIIEDDAQPEGNALVPVEPPENADDWDDIGMGKQELARHHALNILPKNTMGKLWPVYCEHCQKHFEGRNRAKIWQHVSSWDHRKKMGASRSGKFEEEKKTRGIQETVLDASSDRVVSGTCNGLKLNSEQGKQTRIGSDFRECWEEFAAYADFSVASTPSGETCMKVTAHYAEKDWTIQHSKCDGEKAIVYMGSDGSSVCKRCFDLGSEQRFLSRISSFLLDLDAARLLWSRCFASETVDDRIAELKEKALYKRRSKTAYEKMFAKPIEQLHKEVCSSWWGRQRQKMTDTMELFFNLTVKPCIDIEPGQGLKQSYVNTLINYMASEEGTNERDLDMVRQICTGKLQRHPALHGVMTACALRIEGFEKGTTTFRNPKRKEEERQLLLEAGAELSCIGANAKALEFFGLKWMEHNQHQGILEKLNAWGLPNMVSPDAETLQQSDHLISIKFKRPQDSGHRRLICAMDRTYLETSMQLVRTAKGSSFSGGAHRPAGFLDSDESLRPLNRQRGTQVWNTRDVKRASEMESFLLWDSKRAQCIIYELAAYPCLPSASRDERLETGVDDPKHLRGKWECLRRCGFVLENTPSLKWLLCDGHGSHLWVHSLLLGKSIDLPEALMEHVPFFHKLTYHDLPMVCFPLPWRNVRYEGTTIHYLPGIAHLQKNFGEQVRAVLRTLYWGKFWLDNSAALETGLWPAAYVGVDGMSDRQAALLFDPLNYIADPKSPKFAIPYCLQGAFLFSLIGAHAVAPILHKTGDRAWRLEVAMTGLCLLNLGIMMASKTAKRLGLPVRAVWMDSKNHRGLKDLCGASICGLWGCEESTSWPNLTERRLEQRFGRVRTSMPNNCLTASDYWRSSATVMRHDDRKMCESLGKPVDQEELVTANLFCTIAQRAFQAALKLASLCSDTPAAALASEFHATNSGATCEAEMGPDEDDSDHEGEPVPVDAAHVLNRIRESHALQSKTGGQDDTGEDEDIDCIHVPKEDSLECFTAEALARGKDVDFKIAAATEEILTKPSADEEEENKEKERIGTDDRDLFEPRDGRFTLSSALRGHESFETSQDDLVRLLCHLRMAPHGCDADVVGNPLHTRKVVLHKPKRWHDLVRHQIAQADLLDSLPAHRKSRVSAWVEAGENARKESAPSLPPSISIQSGDVVAARWRGEWHVALVLTTYRLLKKGAGAVPCTGQIAKGGLHSARVLMLKQEGDNSELYVGDIDRESLVLPVECIGIRLDGDSCKRKASMNGVKILLGEDSMRALCHLEKTMPCDNKPLVKPRGRGKAIKYIKPCPDNFRRTKQGAKLICQELKRLLEEEAKMFPHKALMTADQSHVRFTQSGTNKQIAMEDLMQKAPGFFSVYFTTIRRKTDYGQKVYDWFQTVIRALKDNGSTRELNSLIVQIFEIKLPQTKGLDYAGKEDPENESSESD